MLNYSDVTTLREKGMTNADILKSMGRVVPSAKRSYEAITTNKNIPEWQKESLIGRMLDKKVPRTAPSGLGLMAVSGMNEAQKTYEEKQQKIQEVINPQPKGVLAGAANAAHGAITGQNPSILRGLGTVGRFAQDTIGAGIGLVGRGLDAVVPDAVRGAAIGTDVMGERQLAGEAIGAAAGVVGSGMDKMEQASPELAQDVRDIGNVAMTAADVIGFKGALSGLKGAAKKSFQDIVSTGMAKGAKPRLQGAMRSSPVALQEYNQKAADAVAEIVTNRSLLNYTDDAGEVLSQGHVPTNLSEFAQAIDQSKKRLFEKYSGLSTQATGKGASIDLTDISEKLLAFAENPVKGLADSGKVDYAKKMAVKFLKQGKLDPKQAEELIAELNQSLAKAYSDKAVKGISEVDMSIAGALREALDDVVLQSTGQGYQELKNAYGALKAIEKDVGHSALISARKNIKGLPQLTDIFTGGDILAGALTGNPALFAKGMAGKGIAKWYSYLNSTDSNIMRMFSQAQKYLDSSAMPK